MTTLRYNPQTQKIETLTDGEWVPCGAWVGASPDEVNALLKLYDDALAEAEKALRHTARLLRKHDSLTHGLAEDAADRAAEALREAREGKL